MKAETLKKSILQYAIEGKLVPQDPNDEPASELLKRIKAEKEQLIKEGKIKKDKTESYIFKGEDNKYYEQIGSKIVDITDEIPFEIPQGWEWVRLGNIGDWGSGSTPNKSRYDYYKNGTIYWLKTGDLNDNYINDIPEKITELALKETSVKIKPVGSLLIAMYGATIGKLGILNIPATTNQACCACIKYADINTKYLFYYLLSERDNLRKRGEGGAQPNISREKIIAYLLPVPPLPEQQRIVDKLEQILPLIDEYKINEEKLSKLNETLPAKIKQSILQHAVQGKLVEQDPNDEPASELLKRIKAEKEQLIKESKIKKGKTESYIYKGEDNNYYEQIGSKTIDITDEIPFEIPQGWEWVRLGNIVNIARGGSPRPIQDYLTTAEDGLNWIKIGDTDKGGKYINSTKEKITPDGLHKTRFVRKGDFLLSNSMSFGRPYILNIDGCIHDGWLVLSEVDYCFNKDFLYYLLSSHYIYQQFCGKVSGAVVKNLNSEKVAGALICLPPLSEQQRIVNKIEELLNLCNTLK